MNRDPGNFTVSMEHHQFLVGQSSVVFEWAMFYSYVGGLMEEAGTKISMLEEDMEASPVTGAMVLSGRDSLPDGWLIAWWLIPLSKWVITPVINGISRVNPLITGVITHLRAVGSSPPSGMCCSIRWRS
jgi:hypothetical protein